VETVDIHFSSSRIFPMNAFDWACGNSLFNAFLRSTFWQNDFGFLRLIVKLKDIGAELNATPTADTFFSFDYHLFRHTKILPIIAVIIPYSASDADQGPLSLSAEFFQQSRVPKE
jgi:hypothetical protein